MTAGLAATATDQAPATAAARAPLIRLRQVTKVFYAEDVETHALAAVDLEIQAGEYVAVAGPSGCGKSTLLSILGLLDTPTSGQYWLQGEAVEALTFKARARARNRAIGFIFQSFNLIGDLTVAENVELPLTYRGLTPRRAAAAGRGGARARGHGVSGEAPAGAALGRAAAAGGGGAGGGGQPVDPAVRRADGEPRLEKRRDGDGPAAGPARRGRHHLHGDARPALRRPRPAHHPPLRRAGGGGTGCPRLTDRRRFVRQLL